MRKLFRHLALFLTFMLVFTLLLPGCGSKGSGDDVTITDSDKQQAKADDQGNKVKQESTQVLEKPKTATGEKKKVVIVQESVATYNNDATQSIISELKKNGFEGQNIEIKQLYMSGDQKKNPEEILQIIKDFKPDVACFSDADSIIKQLEGTDIPCITNTGVDNYVDENGKPRKNITGLYAIPKDMTKRAFEFLQKIAPINGKKAVFITVDGFFKKEDIVNSLKAVNVELKDYCESKYVEDYQAAVEKYNKDDEVGWMLVGVWPWTKKDGTTVIQTETAKWDIANRKKPSVTYWEVAVGMGILCGLGVDIPALGTQQGKMAVKVLNGEKIQDIKAEEPVKINMAINKKNADEHGIKFPVDIIGSSRIYTDYEGHTAN